MPVTLFLQVSCWPTRGCRACLCLCLRVCANIEDCNCTSTNCTRDNGKQYMDVPKDQDAWRRSGPRSFCMHRALDCWTLRPVSVAGIRPRRQMRRKAREHEKTKRGKEEKRKQENKENKRPASLHHHHSNSSSNHLAVTQTPSQQMVIWLLTNASREAGRQHSMTVAQAFHRALPQWTESGLRLGERHPQQTHPHAPSISIVLPRPMPVLPPPSSSLSSGASVLAIGTLCCFAPPPLPPSAPPPSPSTLRIFVFSPSENGSTQCRHESQTVSLNGGWRGDNANEDQMQDLPRLPRPPPSPAISMQRVAVLQQFP